MEQWKKKYTHYQRQKQWKVTFNHHGREVPTSIHLPYSMSLEECSQVFLPQEYQLDLSPHRLLSMNNNIKGLQRITQALLSKTLIQLGSPRDIRAAGFAFACRQREEEEQRQTLYVQQQELLQEQAFNASRRAIIATQKAHRSKQFAELSARKAEQLHVHALALKRKSALAATQSKAAQERAVFQQHRAMVAQETSIAANSFYQQKKKEHQKALAAMKDSEAISAEMSKRHQDIVLTQSLQSTSERILSLCLHDRHKEAEKLYKQTIRSFQSRTKTPEMIQILHNFTEIYVRTQPIEDGHEAPTPYMFTQPFLTIEMRALVVDWMMSLASKFKFSTTSLFRSVLLLDHTLELKTLRPKQLQQLAATTVYQAVTEEGNMYAHEEFAQYLVNQSGDICTIHDLIQDAKHLQCPTAVPTTILHFKQIMQHFNLEPSQEAVGIYFCYRALLEHDLLLFQPKVMALSATFLTFQLNTIHCARFQQFWTQLGQQYSEMNVIHDCIHRLSMLGKVRPIVTIGHCQPLHAIVRLFTKKPFKVLLQIEQALQTWTPRHILPQPTVHMKPVPPPKPPSAYVLFSRNMASSNAQEIAQKWHGKDDPSGMKKEALGQYERLMQTYHQELERFRMASRMYYSQHS